MRVVFILGLGRIGWLLGLLIALTLTTVSTARVLDAVDHAQGAAHTHAGLTLAYPAPHDDHDGHDAVGDVDSAQQDQSDAQPGPAHHHHADPGAGLTSADPGAKPIPRAQCARARAPEARPSDVVLEEPQRPPQPVHATA